MSNCPLLFPLRSQDEMEAPGQKWRSSQCKDYTAIVTCFAPRWVFVYTCMCISMWVSIYLCVDIRVGELAKWMSLSLMKTCKTICHSLSGPGLGPVNIFLGCSHTEGKRWTTKWGWNTMTDSHHFFPRLQRQIWATEYKLILSSLYPEEKKRQEDNLHIQSRCQGSYSSLHF